MMTIHPYDNNNELQDETVASRTDTDNTITARTDELTFSPSQQHKAVKAQLISTITHGLHDPLTVVLGYLEFFKESVDRYMSDKERAYYMRMRRAIDQIDDMINDGVMLERMFNDDALPRNMIFLDQMTQGIVNLTRASPDVAARHQHVEAYIQNGHGTIEGEATLLNRAMQTLVNNALQKTPDGGTIIIAHYVVTDSGQGWGGFSVQDSGICIEESERAHVFEPRAQQSPTHRPILTKPSVALYLVKQIVEWHGGRTLFSAVPEEGNLFGFELPLVAVDATMWG